MNFANLDWLTVLLNWFPMLLIFAVWIFFMRQLQRGGGFGGHQKRAADALERIAAALEKRS
jgi:ATP-dependent Zn protease